MLKEFTEKFDFFDGGEGGEGGREGRGGSRKTNIWGELLKKVLVKAFTTLFKILRSVGKKIRF